MKLLLILEHHFFKDTQGKVWCDRIVDYDYLKRYLLSFEEVIVCARMKQVTTVSATWKQSSGPHISFCPLPDFQGALVSLKNVFHIRKIVKNALTQADVCLLRTPSPISILAYAAVKHSSKPFGLEMVMAADRMFEKINLSSKIVNKALDRYVQSMCLEAKGVAYVTNHILQEKYPTRGFTASYSSIDLIADCFYTPSWQEKPDVFTLVHTGYMDNTRKGQGVLLEATALLRKKGYPIQVLLIGDGARRHELEKLTEQLNISSVVTFTGAINDRSALLKKLQQAHLFVLPSKAEGLPRAILEAMAVGLPCVASDVDGIPELLEPSCLVHGFNPQDYANSIAYLLDNWDEMKRQSERNFKLAQEFEKSKLDYKRKQFYDQLSLLTKEHE